MKSFLNLRRNSSPRRRSMQNQLLRSFGIAALVCMTGWMMSAWGDLPSWIRNIEAGTAIESAIFRSMSLPGGDMLFRRPPSETRPALSELIKAQPKSADLYSLRALEDERPHVRHPGRLGSSERWSASPDARSRRQRRKRRRRPRGRSSRAR